MAQISISIVKEIPFRDSFQEFSNTYTYGAVGPQPQSDFFGTAENLIDELVTIEKGFHAAKVAFKRARLWTSGGSVAENRTLVEKSLSGTGAAANTLLDPERAILVMWPAGIDSRGRRVYLRKWYHPCGSFGAAVSTYSTGIVEQATGFTQAQRQAIVTAVDPVTRIGAAEEWGLIADSGRERDGGAPVAHRYLEHHQLGDQWR